MPFKPRGACSLYANRTINYSHISRASLFPTRPSKKSWFPKICFHCKKRLLVRKRLYDQSKFIGRALTDLQRGRGLGGREPEFREFFAEIHRTGRNFQRRLVLLPKFLTALTQWQPEKSLNQRKLSNNASSQSVKCHQFVLRDSDWSI